MNTKQTDECRHPKAERRRVMSASLCVEKQTDMFPRLSGRFVKYVWRLVVQIPIGIFNKHL